MALLDRFRQPTRRKSVADDVANNVAHILSTRRGYGAILNDYGISDSGTEINRNLLIERMTSEIILSLHKYEDRLINVRVTVAESLPTSTRLALSVSGDLREGGEPIEVVLDPVKGVVLLINSIHR